MNWFTKNLTSYFGPKVGALWNSITALWNDTSATWNGTDSDSWYNKNNTPWEDRN